MLSRIALAGLFVLSSVAFVVAQEAPATSQAAAKVAPMDFRKLKELMPAELCGLKRTGNEGQKMSLGEFTISQATGDFGGGDEENAPTIHVDIQDFAGATGMGDVMTAWQTLEIDKETDGGYEKTTKVAGQPAFESFQREGKSGQLQIYVAKRYYVNVTASNLTQEQFKKLGESLPIKKLAELKE
ncbi:MAG TPA: hypothetical protein VER17_05500 [Tepidisphaeraceae bacterium]|nr:hypothetical protein [Tepidisphaeraceae bacterium]